MRTLAAPGPFAAMLGIDEFTLRRAEAGAMAFDELPAAYLSHLDAIEAEIDLVGLRSLARRVEGPTETRGEERSGSGPVVVTLAPGRSRQGTGDLSHAG